MSRSSRPRSSIDVRTLTTQQIRDRSPSPKPVWMPVDPRANASGIPPPPFKTR